MKKTNWTKEERQIDWTKVNELTEILHGPAAKVVHFFADAYDYDFIVLVRKKSDDSFADIIENRCNRYFGKFNFGVFSVDTSYLRDYYPDEFPQYDYDEDGDLCRVVSQLEKLEVIPWRKLPRVKEENKN